MSLIRISEVVARVGLSKTTVYRAIARGEFPRPRKFGSSALWLDSEVDAWIAKLASTSSVTPKEAA